MLIVFIFLWVALEELIIFFVVSDVLPLRLSPSTHQRFTFLSWARSLSPALSFVDSPLSSNFLASCLCISALRVRSRCPSSSCSLSTLALGSSSASEIPASQSPLSFTILVFFVSLQVLCSAFVHVSLLINIVFWALRTLCMLLRLYLKALMNSIIRDFVVTMVLLMNFKGGVTRNGSWTNYLLFMLWCSDWQLFQEGFTGTEEVTLLFIWLKLYVD